MGYADDSSNIFINDIVGPRLEGANVDNHINFTGPVPNGLLRFKGLDR